MPIFNVVPPVSTTPNYTESVIVTDSADAHNVGFVLKDGSANILATLYESASDEGVLDLRAGGTSSGTITGTSTAFVVSAVGQLNLDAPNDVLQINPTGQWTAVGSYLSIMDGGGDPELDYPGIEMTSGTGGIIKIQDSADGSDICTITGDSSNNRTSIVSADQFTLTAQANSLIFYGATGYHFASLQPIRLPSLTTTQRDALGGLIEGLALWNTTTHSLQVYDGTSWADAP